MRANKPLLGFGPAGWTLLAVAITLAYVWYTGYDLRYQIMRLICDVFGVKTMMNFVVYVITFHSLNVLYPPPDMEFGLIGLCALLIAMQVHPERMGVLRWTLAFALGVGTPPGVVYIIGVLGRLGHFPTNDALRWATALMLAGVILSASVWWIMRSRTAMIGTLALSATGAALESIVIAAPTAIGGDIAIAIPWFMWAWNPLLFALLLYVAVRARLRAWPEYACQTCGYDLRGITGKVCPECGAGVHTEPIAAALTGADPLPSHHG